MDEECDRQIGQTGLLPGVPRHLRPANVPSHPRSPPPRQAPYRICPAPAQAHTDPCLSYGPDPYLIIRRALVGGSRSCQFLFEARDRVDFPLTLLWRAGGTLAVGGDRLPAMEADPPAGRAHRDAMLPEFEGLDRWLPRPHRERLSAA